MKMFFAYIMATAFLVSTVFGCTISPSRKQLTFQTEKVDVKEDNTSAFVTLSPSGDDRSSNLKYVMAVYHSSIWTEMKKRSVTIKTQPKLDEIHNEDSVKNLSDKELAQLKQACNDGLKCVAVDQILVLQTITQSTRDGQISVRKAITKITKVLTEFTTEYHKDTYQYEQVKETDNDAKVYQSLTTIVEDNKELCRIDVGSGTTNPAKKDDDGGVPLVNFGTVNNYNINNGTINRATINAVPPVDIAIEQTPGSSADNGNSGQMSPVATDVPSNNAIRSSAAEEGNQNNVAQDDSIQGHDTCKGKPVNVRTGKTGVDGPTDTKTSAPTDTDVSNNTDASSYDVSAKIVPNNYGLDNCQNRDKGTNHTNTDIVSAGLRNDSSVKKGIVEDGSLNNGNMKVYNFNKGIINKGVITNSTASGGGVINVGTFNAGPVNIDTFTKHNNNGIQMSYNSSDARQYVDSINNMYSTIIEGFANK